MTINRLTLFKIPRKEDLPPMLEQYRILQSTAIKNGKSYILSVQVGTTIPDPRSQGYTLAVRTEFETLDDMRYYDSECEAHKALKRVAVGKREGDVLAVYFEDAIGAKIL